MDEILLFHSAQGLRPGVRAAADILRAAGHSVRTPDYYDGEVFDTLHEGIAKRDRLGIEEIRRRILAIGDELEWPTVFMGFSLGAYAAQLLAAHHPFARGAVLIHGGGPVEAVTGDKWPSWVPVQVHHAVEDPWIDPAEIAALGEEVVAAGSVFGLHTYPGDAHLFADPDLPGYDPDSAALLWRRVVGFLARI
jgi:dienelactone hydrolase